MGRFDRCAVMKGVNTKPGQAGCAARMREYHVFSGTLSALQKDAKTLLYKMVSAGRMVRLESAATKDAPNKANKEVFVISMVGSTSVSAKGAPGMR